MSILFRFVVVLTLGLMLPSTALADGIRVATWNMEWLFDSNTTGNSGPGLENSAPNPAEFQSRINRGLLGIRANIVSADPKIQQF